jgi:hypothetical protein
MDPMPTTIQESLVFGNFADVVYYKGNSRRFENVGPMRSQPNRESVCDYDQNHMASDAPRAG